MILQYSKEMEVLRKINSTIEKSNMDKNEILQYSIVLGLESVRIKHLLKSFDYEVAILYGFTGQ